MTEAGAADLPRAASLLGAARDLAVSCRPAHWPKNLLLYAALVFSVGAAWSPREPGTWLPLLAASTLAFVLFSAIASGEYLVNDAVDVERDRLHPRKRLRPVAAGRLGRSVAFASGGALIAAGVTGSFALSTAFAASAAAYALLTLAYSLGLKRVAGLDVACIAGGFSLRAVAGALAIDVPISPWIVVCSTLGALFVALAKRRQEQALLPGDEGRGHRGVLAHYRSGVLDRLTAATAAATVVAYTLYTLLAPNLPRNRSMLLTVPFVVYGVWRYRRLTERSPDLNADELVVRDRPLLVTIALFAATSLALMLAAE